MDRPCSFHTRAQIDQQVAARGPQLPGRLILLRGQIELVALFGQLGELLVRAEVIGRLRERLLPARDPFAQGPVHILEGLRRGWVALLAQPVEHAPRGHLLLGFVTQEGVFERDLIVGRIERHRFRELVARRFGFADLQQRVGQVLADRSPPGIELRGLLKPLDGGVVVLRPKGRISPVQ